MDEARAARENRLAFRRNKRARFEKGESSSRGAQVDSPSKDIQVHEVGGVHGTGGTQPEILNVGAPDYRCQYCGAYFWYRERCRRLSRSSNARYTLCCREGRVSLPIVKKPPSVLDVLLHSRAGSRSLNFKDKIRLYNSMFAFTPMGVRIDESINDGKGPYVFKVSGQVCHRIGSVLPVEGSKLMFAQLYVYDTANEVVNRINAFRDSYTQRNEPQQEIVQQLIEMLNENNVIVQAFRNYHERFLNCEIPNLKLRIIGVHGNDLPQYTPPISSEILGLVVGDLTVEER